MNRDAFESGRKAEDRRLRGIGLVLCLALFVVSPGGCFLPDIQQAQTDTTRYFVLAEAGLPPVAARPNAPRVAVRMVEVAPYLKNRSLVVRRGENEVKFIDDARWAEPLDVSITRLVRARLAAATGRPAAPDAGLATDYLVNVRVVNCEGVVAGAAGTADLGAEIDLLPAGPASAGPAVRKTFRAKSAAWDGKDYAQLAHRLSEAVAELADAVLTAAQERQ